MRILGTLSGEIAGIVAHLLRPLGRRHRRADDPARPHESGEPIILIPGLAVDESVFAGLRQALTACGAGPVVPFRYSPLITDVRTAADGLAAAVARLHADTGAERVRLVGHSLGGLIARYYVQRLGGHDLVSVVVTIATPHHGTFAAWLLPPLPLAGQLRPGSALLSELAESVPGCPTRFVAFASDADAVIVPRRNAHLDHPDLAARNVLVSGVGHLTLPGDRHVIEETCTVLGPGTPRPENTPAG